MAGKEHLSARYVLRPYVENAAEALDERPTPAMAKVVPDVSPRHRAKKAEQDDERDAVVSRCGPGGGREQEGLARKWNPCALDEDSQSGGGVAQRVNDRSWIHGASYTDGLMAEYADHESSEDPLHILRHSSAHLLAAAVTELYPDAKYGIGPPVQDGFYYDFAFSKAISESDLGAIESRMRRIAQEDRPFVKETMTREQATGAVLGLLALQWGLTSQLVPFDGRHAIGGWVILVSALAVAAGSNAFNLTDGSDGLAAGAGAISFGALALVAVLQHHPSVGLLPAILAGCLVGFLFYNLFPARIFMGDTGSLALGTAMVAAAITTGFLWYLPLLALVFVVETVSVIAQVASFKLTGKRLIRMSPLHNHFIVSGWREMPIALYFWAGSLVAAALAVALARPGSAA